MNSRQRLHSFICTVLFKDAQYPFEAASSSFQPPYLSRQNEDESGSSTSFQHIIRVYFLSIKNSIKSALVLFTPLIVPLNYFDFYNLFKESINLLFKKQLL